MSESRNLKGGEFYGKISKKRTVSSSVISELIHTNKKSLPRHSHELACFSLLLDGSYSESYGRKNFSYRPMTIWWHPTDFQHKDKIGQKGGRFFTIEIRSKGIDTLKEYAKTPEAFYEKSTSLVWLACRLFNEFKNWQSCSELIAEGLTLEMLGHSVRKKGNKENRPPKWLNPVTDKLNSDFTQTISIESLAKQADVHPVHLSSIFRKFHNQTIGEYVQKKRIEMASELLLNREVPLNQIALITGFSDQSHLTRIFKRITGTTPGAFRKSIFDQ